MRIDFSSSELGNTNNHRYFRREKNKLSDFLRNRFTISNTLRFSSELLSILQSFSVESNR